ncbi:MAG: homoserine acetyltransferase, partial [Methanobrevibacter sp.]|nr:homoserine acetyltransferase [Methanobrevibacter sp.]
MDSFEFESGRVLENVQVEYVTSGIPKVDDDGNIVNAVIYCPTLDGGHAILPQYHKFIQGTEFQRDK